MPPGGIGVSLTRGGITLPDAGLGLYMPSGGGDASGADLVGPKGLVGLSTGRCGIGRALAPKGFPGLSTGCLKLAGGSLWGVVDCSDAGTRSLQDVRWLRHDLSDPLER